MKSWLVIGLGFGVVACAVGAVVVVANNPAVGTVHQLSAAVDTATPPAPPPTVIAGRLVRFTAPSGFDQQAPVVLSGLMFEAWNFTGGGVTTGAVSPHLSIAIMTQALGDNASLRLRLQQPKLYAATTAMVNGDKITILTRSDGATEATAFWPHGKYLATLSLTDASSVAATKQLTEVLQSLRWL